MAISQEGATVKSISVRYVGSKLLSEQTVISKLSTKVGQPISVLKTDSDIKRLLANGEITNARMLSKDVSGGVELIVVVECAPIFAGASFKGNQLFSAKRLQKTLELPVNRIVTEGAIHQARRSILSLYKKRGYKETLVECRVSDTDAKGYVHLLFVIEEKASGILRNVSFEGNKAFTDVQLKEVMAQKEQSVRNVIGARGRTDAQSIADDIKQIETYYKDRGYFKVKIVGVAKVKVDHRFDDLVIKVAEGDMQSISGIKVNGMNALSMDTDIAPHLRTKSGQAFSAEDLDADIKMITEKYREKGYNNVRVTPRLR